MSNELTLRPATNSDSEAVKALVFGILTDFGLAPDPASTDADLDDITGHYHARGGSFDVLVESAGTIVGSVGLCPISDGRCELRKMYLSPKVRGQGQGRRLLNHALKRAADLGFRRIDLETASVLKEAIKLYESAGFVPFTPEHLAARCDQAYFLEL